MRKVVAAAVLAVLAVLVSGPRPRAHGAQAPTGGASRGELTQARGRPASQIEAAELASIASRASRLMGERRYDEAIRMLVSADKRYPGDERLVTLLFRAYLRSGRLLEANRILDTGVGGTADRFALVRDLGSAFLEAGMPERAVATWHSILGEDEGRASYYHIEVARLEWNAGMHERALETLRAGRRFSSNAARCTAEIVRLERVRGNFRAAFSAGLEGLVEDVPAATIAAAGPLVASFREAGRPADLVRAVDSLAAGGGGNVPLLRMLHAMLMLETGDAGWAETFLETARRGRMDGREFYQFTQFLLAYPASDGGGWYEDGLERVVEVFIERHGQTPMAAKVLLEAAKRAARLAEEDGPRGRAAAGRCLALADSVLAHAYGRAFAQQAMLIKARALLEHGAAPDEALAVLEGLPYGEERWDLEAERIRLQALLAAGRWEVARRHFEALADSPDTVLAAMGRYGVGMTEFYSGAFEDAARRLAALAEEAPWSEWANDALATAVLLRQAAREGYGTAGLLAAGLAAAGAGRLEQALGALEDLAGTYPSSALAPRALYESALLLVRAGRDDDARARLERVAELYPLDAHAPRALEKLARWLEREDPAAAASWYLTLLERYPQDPWSLRSRERLSRLQAALERGEAGPKEAS